MTRIRWRPCGKAPPLGSQHGEGTRVPPDMVENVHSEPSQAIRKWPYLGFAFLEPAEGFPVVFF